MKQKIENFFKNHPTSTEVHEALGVLFITKTEAEAFLGGVHGHQVVTHARPAAELSPEEKQAAEVKRLEAAIEKQKAVVAKKQETVDKTEGNKKLTAETARIKEQEKLDSLLAELAALINPPQE